MNLLIIIT